MVGDRIRAMAALGTSTTAVLVGVFAIGMSIFWSFGQRSDPGGFLMLLVLWVPFVIMGGAIAGAVVFTVLGAVIEFSSLPRSSLPAVLAVLAGACFCAVVWRLTQLQSLTVAGGLGGLLTGCIVGLRLAVHDDVAKLRSSHGSRSIR